MTVLPCQLGTHTHPCVCMLSHFSRVQLFATLWTVACQALLSMGFSRQEYWSGLPSPPSGDLPDPGGWTCVSCISCIGRRVLYHQCHLGNPYTSILTRNKDNSKVILLTWCIHLEYGWQGRNPFPRREYKVLEWCCLFSLASWNAHPHTYTTKWGKNTHNTYSPNSVGGHMVLAGVCNFPLLLLIPYFLCPQQAP